MYTSLRCPDSLLHRSTLVLFFRSTTKNLVRCCFSRSATKVTLRVIQGALAGVCVYAAALPCCEDLPPDACVPASSPVHPPCELTSLHVHVERASAHVVIRISLQMRRLALTCAPTANRVDCTNTSQEPDHRKETQASIMHWRCPPAQLYRCTVPLGNMTQLHWVTTVHHIDHTLISRKQLPQLASC